MKRDRWCLLLAGLSIVFAIGCVIAAIVEWNGHTFDHVFAVHSVFLWIWLIDTTAVIVLSRFKWYYFLLLVLAPLAILPIPSWMFILFRVLKVPFAP
jgi:hypothetical protein